MKQSKANTSKQKQNKTADPGRRKTDIEGQNPKADDSPDHDVHHDESRQNPYEPQVGKERKDPGKKS